VAGFAYGFWAAVNPPLISEFFGVKVLFILILLCSLLACPLPTRLVFVLLVPLSHLPPSRRLRISASSLPACLLSDAHLCNVMPLAHAISMLLRGLIHQNFGKMYGAFIPSNFIAG
jgi:hypothetical protein